MPNTLAHLAINGITTRTIIRNADLKWIYLGAIIPDLPWILQRLVSVVFPDVNSYDLRLYCVIQSSLLFSFILAGALATISVNYKKTCLILWLGSLLHLLLDAMQTKWANGVNLFAPFKWNTLNFGFFWPESLVTYLLTIFGLIYFLIYFKQALSSPLDITSKFVKQHILGIFLLSSYFLLPFYMLDAPEWTDSHYTKTLRNIDQRQGKYIEIDRVNYQFHPEQSSITTFAGERLQVEGIDLDHDASISIGGFFIAKDRILVNQVHLHFATLRDFSSYLGLGLVALMWLWLLIKKP